jgi:hypothetical protein
MAFSLVSKLPCYANTYWQFERNDHPEAAIRKLHLLLFMNAYIEVDEVVS